MSDCKCKQPCGPCNNNCPDDGEIIESTILDPEDCNTNCCGKTCKDNCGINIQSTNDCLVVDTSECGVVKLTAECPKPTYVKAGDNVTVEETTPPDDCYQDGGDCGIKGGWKISSTDEKVKACGGDSTPGTLIDKLEAGTGINIDPIGCDGSNSRLKISFDDSVLPDCPEPPRIIIRDESSLIDARVSGSDGHTITITDADKGVFYAKLVLADNHIWTEATGQEGVWEQYLGEKAAVNWKPVRQSGGALDVSASLRKGLAFFNGTDAAPGLGVIEITKKGLYQVGFSGSAEFSYGVHAFRVQLYKIPKADRSKTNTIIESRYSGPLGYEPWQPVIGNAGNIKFVSNVTGGGGESRPDVEKGEYHMDYPLIGEKTEVEGQHGIGYSASLGAVMDRVTVTGNTIVELDEGDRLRIGLKMSTSIMHSGDMMAKIPASFLTGHFALLGADAGQSDNGGEAGFSYYANLIHPLLS